MRYWEIMDRYVNIIVFEFFFSFLFYKLFYQNSENLVLISSDILLVYIIKIKYSIGNDREKQSIYGERSLSMYGERKREREAGYHKPPFVITTLSIKLNEWGFLLVLMVWGLF